MASSNAASNSPVEKLTVCAICFDSFNTPRCLPCLHTFCHRCLLSYIETTCKQKTSPVGFPCPLCRNFVPAPVFPGLPEKWVERMPINKTVQVMVDKSDDIWYCDACKRDEEEKIAICWCKSCLESLCEACNKFHKKSLASREHKVIPLASLKEVAVNDIDENEAHLHCSTHQKKIRYFCDDHQEACCTRCVCIQHRTCRQVITIENKAKNLHESKKVNALLKEIERYTKAVTKIKEQEENNIAELDKVSDDLIKQSSDYKTKVIRHIDALLEKHLDEISKVTKDNRQKLSDSVEAFSDRELLANLYTKTLKTINEGGASVALAVEYHKIKKQFSKIADLGVTQLEFHMHQNYEEKFQELFKISKFAKLVLNEQSMKFSFDMNMMVHATVDVAFELVQSSGKITGGCFLQDRGILLVDARQPDKLLYFNNTGECVHKWNISFRPNDVTLKDSDVFVSSSGSYYRGIHGVTFLENQRKLIPSDRLHYCKNEECFGIKCANGFIYVTCGRSILKVDADGNLVKRYLTEKETYSVAVDKNNHVIYSSCTSHSVTSLNESGRELFRYTHPDLKYPRSLDVDYEGYIYVAGRDSDNVHILSPSGQLLRIFKVSKPNCIKFKTGSRICLIGSYNSSCTKIYEIKVPEI
ncbi:tripartite motif-containing protein 45-like [Ostrea edulis]|uniref:tripartite motif-containing protein 45-like n=1 Tax=Ostrea edulis TaxID=37623 RepID=UPI0024AFCE24|nr:tripartite motif-containing protein 45-like [Ostrea edulis]